MKKIERRTIVCAALALCLGVGLCVFLVKFFLQGGDWVSSAFNRHLYNSQGQLVVGTVLDRDGSHPIIIRRGALASADKYMDLQRKALIVIRIQQAQVGPLAHLDAATLHRVAEVSAHTGNDEGKHQ